MSSGEIDYGMFGEYNIWYLPTPLPAGYYVWLGNRFDVDSIQVAWYSTLEAAYAFVGYTPDPDPGPIFLETYRGYDLYQDGTSFKAYLEGSLKFMSVSLTGVKGMIDDYLDGAGYLSTLTVTVVNPGGGLVSLGSAPGAVSVLDGPQTYLWGFAVADSIYVHFEPGEGYSIGELYVDGVRRYGPDEWVGMSTSHTMTITWSGAGPPPPVTYACPVCGEVFASQAELDAHLAEFHPDEGPVFLETYRGYDLYQDGTSFKAYLEGNLRFMSVSLAGLKAMIDDYLGPGPEPPAPGGSFIDRVNYAISAYGLGFGLAVLWGLGLYEIANKKK